MEGKVILLHHTSLRVSFKIDPPFALPDYLLIFLDSFEGMSALQKEEITSLITEF